MADDNDQPTTTTDADDDATRYCVYDVTLARFVGPVTSKRPGKAKVSALVGDHDHEVRKV